MDAEPTVVDELFSSHPEATMSSNRHIYSKDQTACAKESCASNYTRGYQDHMRQTLSEALDIIRKKIEECDYFFGFNFTHSISGGCGSGSVDYLMENLKTQYPKKMLINFPIFPSKNISNIVTGYYNSLLSSHAFLESTDATFPITNEELYSFMEKKLDVSSPRY